MTVAIRMGPMQVIKLSDAIQPLPRAVTQFVHGVAKPFLATGERLAARRGQTLSMAVDGSQTQAQTDPGEASVRHHSAVSTSGVRSMHAWQSINTSKR